MNETQLGNSMRALPRAKASPAFTSDVLRQVRLQKDGCAERRTPLLWRFGAAFAMAACLAILVHGAMLFHAQRQHVATLRAEQQELEAELEAVKKIASEAEPVLVLEDAQGTRVIVDLDSAIQPASLRTFD